MKKNTGFLWTVLGILAAWLVLYFAVIHPAFLRWGATAEENARALPGEAAGGRIPPAVSLNTRAVTIDAPPEKVWPWLARLGIGRGGFYSYTWLENLMLAGIHNNEDPDSAASARASGNFVRSFQFGSDKAGFNGWRFEVLEKSRSFYLDPGWGPFVLEPVGTTQTRLLVRSRGGAVNPAANALLALLFDPIHFTMEKRMMVEVKRLAEGRLDPMRLLAAPAALGFLMAAILASAVILAAPSRIPKRDRRSVAESGPPQKLWILVPVLYALLIAILTRDIKSALTGFTAAALVVAGFRALGRRGWAFIAGFWIYADLVLIYAHDAYLIFGLGFLAAAFVALEVRALHLKRARLAAPGEIKETP
jgi:hypothetical protein